ncbi:MAG: endonuclease [Blastocatellia bacterium]|nr:endonuclease [Blastocatellia bacterium]
MEIKQTGSIWRRRPKLRAQIVKRVCETLEEEYGRPRLGNPIKPLDDLIFILISNRTSRNLAEQTYERLKKKFPQWDKILESPPSKLRAVLKPAGLSRKKSHQIRSLLRKVKGDFGKCNLDRLAQWQEREIHKYLTALVGVSDKVAKCVMLYTLSSDVLPVDVHVYRVSKRLGWTARNRAAQAHDELEALIPPSRRFAFHVDCIAHGRAICRSKPDCERCRIRSHCEYFRTVK